MRAKRTPRKRNVFGASQTGRLHVWETWDRKDPEFQAGATQITLVRDLKANYARTAVLLGSKIRTLACESRMPFIVHAILQLGPARTLCRPPCAAGSRGTRRCAWNAA